MAISIVGSTTADSGAGTGTPTLSIPAGVSSGDLLLTLVSTVAAGVPAAVTGWTLLISQSNATAGSTVAVYTRVADGTEAASYTFGLGGARKYGALMVAVRGAGTTVDTSFTNVDTTAGPSMDTPGGTIAAAGEYLFSLFASRSTQGTITDTPDAATTEVVTSSNSASTGTPWTQASFAYELAGSTTAAVRTNTYNVNVTGFTVTLALTAPGGAGQAVSPATAAATSDGSSTIKAIGQVQPNSVAGASTGQVSAVTAPTQVVPSSGASTSGATATVSTGGASSPVSVTPGTAASTSSASLVYTVTLLLNITPSTPRSGAPSIVITAPTAGPVDLGSPSANGVSGGLLSLSITIIAAPIQPITPLNPVDRHQARVSSGTEQVPSYTHATLMALAAPTSGSLVYGPKGFTLSLDEASVDGGVYATDPYLLSALRDSGLFTVQG